MKLPPGKSLGNYRSGVLTQKNWTGEVSKREEGSDDQSIVRSSGGGRRSFPEDWSNPSAGEGDWRLTRRCSSTKWMSLTDACGQ